MPRGRAHEPGPLSRAIGLILSIEVAQQGLTQGELGGMVGISESQIGKFLRVDRVLNIEQLASICRALGLDLIDVVREALGSR